MKAQPATQANSTVVVSKVQPTEVVVTKAPTTSTVVITRADVTDASKSSSATELEELAVELARAKADKSRLENELSALFDTTATALPTNTVDQ